MEYVPRLICLLALWVPVGSAQGVRTAERRTQPIQVSSFERKIDQRVERFATSGKTMMGGLVELAYRYQLPMAVEYADRDAATRPLNLEFRKKSVREILLGIVGQSPEYRVSFSGGIVDIFSPKAREDPSNLLNTVIKDFSIKDMETRRADIQLFCAFTSVLSFSVCAGSSAVGQWEPTRITVHLQNARAYEISECDRGAKWKSHLDE